MRRRITVTDKTIAELEPVYPSWHRKAGQVLKEGEHYDFPDSDEGGLAVRVSSTGHKTFVLILRFPGATQPTRRRLRDVYTIAVARDMARKWKVLIGQGIDPAVQEERERQAREEQRKNTFAAVAEDFFADKLPSERKGREVERDIRREFFGRWGSRPITDITDLDVLEVIKAKKRTAPAQARNLLGFAKR